MSLVKVAVVASSVLQGFATSSLSKATCSTEDTVRSASECFSVGTSSVPGWGHTYTTVHDKNLPAGCSVSLESLEGSSWVDVNWNEATEHASCDHGSPSKLRRRAFASTKAMNITVEMDEAKGRVEITMTGPDDTWLGVSFGVRSMCLHPQGDECPDGEGPYAIIASQYYASWFVTQRKLDYHGPGRRLENEGGMETMGDVFFDNNRTMTLRRPLAGATPDHFTFDGKATTLDIVTVQGYDKFFGKHKVHDVSTLHFLPVDEATCICRDGVLDPWTDVETVGAELPAVMV